MKNKLYLFTSILTLSVFSFACKQTTIDPNQKVKEITEVTEKNTIDRNKGAHIVAPEMTKVLKDTLGIVMYELTIEPGDTLPWHEHPYHTSYVLEGGTLEIIFKDTTEIAEFPKGRAGLGPPFGDIAINRGETTIKVLMHELYSLDTNN